MGHVASRETDTVSYILYTRHVTSRGTEYCTYCTWDTWPQKKQNAVFCTVHGGNTDAVHCTGYETLVETENCTYRTWRMRPWRH
jgi:hypothetical protein